ncbi:hypothetical protein E1B22_12580 (plasmid) [Thermaerobacter sp. FW80]|uniref:hypothetical protein n=1 Tax=Thermaerobacter sp. FW80 TaxID=2546351 RepID=UPI001074B960|nr:hypothetical protein [Thermaerobacter sp. FW80]QBS38735.1 hypothetical protein E1B22_12540 [Thermaerobacter sp. FW80]QBS38742.1 hypothetical protein E1B22_12580 [Thermaerobacter sp. FW80]
MAVATKRSKAVAVKRVPWERLPGEPAKAYAYFRIYKEMPPSRRCLRRVAEKVLESSTRPVKLNSALTTLKRYSTRWRWQERVAAWDEYCYVLGLLAADLLDRRVVAPRAWGAVKAVDRWLREEYLARDITEREKVG